MPRYSFNGHRIHTWVFAETMDIFLTIPELGQKLGHEVKRGAELEIFMTQFTEIQYSFPNLKLTFYKLS